MLLCLYLNANAAETEKVALCSLCVAGDYKSSSENPSGSTWGKQIGFGDSRVFS